MKKTISLLLSVVTIACVFTACSNALKFESKEDMHKYLKGMWQYGFDEYLVFDNESIYYLEESHFRDFESDFFEAYKSGGEEAVKSLTYEEVVSDFEIEKIAYKYNSSDLTYTPDKGLIVINSPEIKGTVSVEKDGVKYKDGDDEDDEFISLEKIADDIDFAKIENGKEYFEKEKNVYKPDPKDFMPSTKEYYTRLKKVFPDIKNFKLALDNKSKMYSDTGSTKNYRQIISFNDNVMYFIDKPLDLTIKYSTDFGSNIPNLFIQDKTGYCFEDVFEAFLTLGEDNPLFIREEEFSKEFEEKYTVSDGYINFETTKENIKYQLIIEADTKATILYVYVN